MSPAASFLQDDCFWDHVDAGVLPEQTPLFLGFFEGEPLSNALVRRFGLSSAEAEFELHAVRQEVEL